MLTSNGTNCDTHTHTHTHTHTRSHRQSGTPAHTRPYPLTHPLPPRHPHTHAHIHTLGASCAWPLVSLSVLLIGNNAPARAGAGGGVGAGQATDGASRARQGARRRPSVSRQCARMPSTVGRMAPLVSVPNVPPPPGSAPCRMGHREDACGCPCVCASPRVGWSRCRQTDIHIHRRSVCMYLCMGKKGERPWSSPVATLCVSALSPSLALFLCCTVCVSVNKGADRASVRWARRASSNACNAWRTAVSCHPTARPHICTQR
jgi:hypothetical protein